MGGGEEIICIGTTKPGIYDNLSLIKYPFDDLLKRGKLCNFPFSILLVYFTLWKMIKLVIFFISILNAICSSLFCDLILINNFITKGNNFFYHGMHFLSSHTHQSY